MSAASDTLSRSRSTAGGGATSIDQATIRRAVGSATFERGYDYADSGAVLSVQRINRPGHQDVLLGSVQGTAGRRYTVVVSVGGNRDAVSGSCTCPMHGECKHVVAVLLAGLQPSEYAPVPPWESALAGLLETDGPDTGNAPLALQFELDPVSGRVGMRPVTLSQSGRWVRSGTGWSTLPYYRYGQSRSAAWELLSEISALNRAAAPTYYGSPEPTIYLDSFPSPRIWGVLAQSDDADLPLVGAKGTVTLNDTASLGLDFTESVNGWVLRPQISVGGERIAGADVDYIDAEGVTVDGVNGDRVHVDGLNGDRVHADAMNAAGQRPPGQTAAHDGWLLMGSPAHGVAWWPPRRPQNLHLSPLDRPLAAPVGRLLTSPGPITIPAADTERFTAEYYPLLRRALRLSSDDGSVDLPEIRPPVLLLTVAQQRADVMELDWCFRYVTGTSGVDVPLTGRSAARDPGAERAVLERILPLTKALDALQTGAGALAAQARLAGAEVIAFSRDVLPGIAGDDDVQVRFTGEITLREAETVPVIALSGEAGRAESDWFDLTVDVAVDGEAVPFASLFTALATEQPYLVLPSGTYFALDTPELKQLHALIVEARALVDSPGEGIRLGRYQADLWAELERLGVIDAQAAEWSRAVRSLADGDGVPEVVQPPGLHAQLRPYQQEGLNWLAFLFQHQLGGVLADDMGLGKTIQSLGLICHAREQQPDAPPFLVVAPTSVVGNWAAESRRFAPYLKLATVIETEARRGVSLSEMAEHVDVIVTSHTLFRLEFDDYAALPWSGLLLDEAQVAKNHQSKAYQCAKRLATPFKLAITGTPMENNLMELWSMFSITAAGLFADPRRFTEYYRTPIEKSGNTERLALLRQRARPFLLRRTKGEVASDLPEKLEQVIELDLHPRHRRVYETYLQRERQKVLGLLGDLDKNRFEIFRSITLLRQASLDVSLVGDEHAKVPSTKLDSLTELLDDIVAEGHRVLVFSQFTRLLARVRTRLDAANIDYCYLDGTTRNRPAVLREFKAGTAPVFLISLKAGGVGLNLTEADYCILLDPWWNPATEAQAIDRAHRIGQDKKVMVYRLVARDTIEEKVMALKAKKAALFNSVLAGGGAGSAQLTATEIRGLLA